MNWISDSINEWIQIICNDILNIVFGAMNKIYEFSGDSLVTSTYVTSASVVTSDVATIIVSIVVIYNVISIYIFETAGDSEQDPMQLLVNSAIAVALIQSFPALFNWALDLARKFTTDISTLDVTTTTADGFIAQLEQGLLTNNLAIANFPIILLCFVIGLICFVIKAFIRSGELALMKIVFPIFCCDLLTASKERFNAFITSFCVTTFCYGLQVFCFKLCLQQFFNLTSSLNIIFSFVWLVMAIKAPKWLEKYAYSSGLGGAVRAGATSSAQVMMSMLARKAA